MRILASLYVLCIPALLVGQVASPRQQTSTEQAAAQSMADQRAGVTPGDVGQGVVVDSVKKSSEGEKAGLQPGDILLHWTRDAAKGEIASPFDLSWVEIEQAPRGSVSVEGFRGAEKRVWSLGQASWGIDARPNLSGDLLATYLEGQKLATAGKPSDAVKVWRSAVDKMTITGSQRELATWFLSHGAESLTTAKQWKEADAAFQEAVDKIAGAGSLAEAQALRGWCVAFRERRDWADALKHCQEAAAQSANRWPESLITADTLGHVASMLYVRGDLAGAGKIFSQALEIQQKLAPGSLSLTRSLNGLGLVAWQRGDLAIAEKYLVQSLEIVEKLGPGSLLAEAGLGNLGLLAGERGDGKKEEEYDLQALAIYEKLAPDSLDTALALNNLGAVVIDRDMSLAEQYYLRALAIREKLAPDSLDTAMSLNNLGNLAKQRGDFSKAEAYHRRALAIKEKRAPNSLTLALTLNNLGSLSYSQQDLARSEEYFNRSLEIRNKLAPGGSAVAMSLSNLAIIARDQAQWQKAEEYFQQALAIRQKLAGESLETADTIFELGVMDELRGNLTKAEEYYSKALEVNKKLAPESITIANCLLPLGNLAFKEGKLVKAEEYYREALPLWQRLAPEREEYGDTLAALATVMVRRGQFDQATPLFEQALTVQEKQMSHFGGEEEGRSSFRALHASNYQSYVDLLVQQKQTERAFQVLERSRARTLLEVLGSHRANVTKAMTSEERETEAKLQTQLASLNRQLQAERSSPKPDATRLAALSSDLQKAQLRYSDFQASLYVAHPELQAQRGQIQPVSLDEAAGLLPDKRCAFLEFMVAEDKTYLFVLTQSSGRNASKPELNTYSIDIKSKDLEQEAEQFRRQLAERNLRFGEAARRLYGLLVRPAQARLAQADALLIVPDGPLWNLPFQALQPRPGHYLIEDHAVAYAPSLTILREMVRLRLRNGNTTKNNTASGSPNSGTAVDPASQTLFAMGDPILGTATSEVAKLTYRDGTLTSLPEAAREVESLEAVYGRQQSRVFVGAAASEEQFKAHAGEFRILHLATHGFLNDTSPMFSHLLLSPGNDKEDGLLQTWEIMNLDLHADLAVLSACETARGRVTTGEGVIGLAWAFFVAGVPTTVVSQWSVASASTAALMIAFHHIRKTTEKASDPLGTARALQCAELKLLHSRKYSAPFYWAGFITLGDPR
jgi:CHAT domain-containing protein/Tfp pilus assembly protein PilF